MDAGKPLVAEVVQIKLGDDKVPAFLAESTELSISDEKHIIEIVLKDSIVSHNT